MTDARFLEYSLGENIKTHVTQLTFLATFFKKKYEFTFLTTELSHPHSQTTLLDINME